jgi:hypothetical protein
MICLTAYIIVSFLCYLIYKGDCGPYKNLANFEPRVGYPWLRALSLHQVARYFTCYEIKGLKLGDT